jgi:hypothetical protein
MERESSRKGARAGQGRGGRITPERRGGGEVGFSPAGGEEAEFR